MSISKKTVLITGCSEGGIGAAMAKVLHEKGYYVFATLRNKCKIGILGELEHVEVLEFDVVSKDSVVRCAEHVRKRTGGTLDMLVNNAGQGFLMPLLDVDIDKAKCLFDVNFWGVLNVVQAFAPMIIEAKGILVNHSSVSCNMLLPWKGMYIWFSPRNISKHACTLSRPCSTSPIGSYVEIYRHLHLFQSGGYPIIRGPTGRA